MNLTAPSPTLSSAPAVAPIPSASDRDRESGPIQPPRQPTEDYRTVVYLMLFRVVLASVLLLCTISLAITHGTSDSLGRVFARFLFGLLALAYAATVVYAMLLPRIEHLVGFAYLQIGVDLFLIAVLVHATGGAQSAFTILFMIQVIAVALLPERYGAAYVATASALHRGGGDPGGLLPPAAHRARARACSPGRCPPRICSSAWCSTWRPSPPWAPWG